MTFQTHAKKDTADDNLGTVKLYLDEGCIVKTPATVCMKPEGKWKQTLRKFRELSNVGHRSKILSSLLPS